MDATVDSVDLVELALAVALEELAKGVREQGGRNRGPEVDEYVRSVGLDPEGAHAWCMAGIYWCYRQASQRLFTVNPCPRTARALGLWSLADGACKSDTPTRGAIGVLDTGAPGGAGHVYLVETVHAIGTLDSVEFNTNREGSREGDSVWRHKDWNPLLGKRGVLKGYVDLSKVPPRTT